MTVIQQKRSTTAGNVPSLVQLAEGELAINLADKRLYTSNNSLVIDLNRVRPRRTVISSSATPTPNFDNEDKFFISALAVAAIFGAPIGTPEDGSQLMVRIKDDGVSRTLAWNAIYRASAWLPLPTETTVNKTMTLGFIYNGPDNRWDLLAVIDGL